MVQYKKQREFLSIEQENKSVEKYERELVSLPSLETFVPENWYLLKELRIGSPYIIFLSPGCILVSMVTPCNFHQGDNFVAQSPSVSSQNFAGSFLVG